MCYRTEGLYLVRTADGKRISINCNTYACRECGPRKVSRLKKAIVNETKNWNHIRFWTFTMSSAGFAEPRIHLDKLRAAWHKFLTYIRRTKSLRKHKRNFKYIKVFEPHKSGFLHIHLVTDTYLPWNIVAEIWESCCQDVLNRQEHCGSAFVKGIGTPWQSANYIVKYMTKCIELATYLMSRYNCSSGVVLFERKGSSADSWYLLNTWLPDPYASLGRPSSLPLLVVSKNTSTNFTSKIETLELFPGDFLKR